MIFTLYYLLAGFYLIDQILGWPWCIAAASCNGSAISPPNAKLQSWANYLFLFIIRNDRRQIRNKKFLFYFCTVCVCVSFITVTYVVTILF